jgi:hypothetical protein
MTTRRDSMSTRLGRELQNWFSLARTIADSGRIRNRPEQPLRERVHAASGFLRDGGSLQPACGNPKRVPDAAATWQRPSLVTTARLSRPPPRTTSPPHRAQTWRHRR